MDVVDVRGPRFSAAVTSVVLALAFVTGWLPLLALQVVVFAVGAVAGLRWSPYGNLFRFLKRRLDLGPPPATEPAAGPRFSQALGLACTGTGLVALLAGRETLGWTLVVAVIALSALLAATGLCVGCELYGLRRREGRVVAADATIERGRLERLGVPPGACALIEFTAPGCRTCAAARAVLDEVAATRRGVRVVTLDVGAHLDLAREHGVMRAPTTLVVAPGGHVRHRVHGVPDRRELQALLCPSDRAA